MLSAMEAAIQRKATKQFIDADPTDIVLKTIEESWVGGTKKTVPGPDKPSQTFKIIWEGQSGIDRQPPNGSRRYDFILIGEHDADVSLNDFWKVGEQENRIEWIAPFNDYEVVAGGFSYGASPA